MHEDQSSPLPTETWCQWHGGYTTTGRMVVAIEQASGPGVSIYACANCRQRHKLQPWDETAS